MNFLSALLILIHAVLAGAWTTTTPAPAPHGITAPAPAPAAGGAPTVAAPTAPHYGPPAPHHAPSGPTAPRCGPDADWDGVGCVHRQDPDEVIGRQIDCPDGSVGVVVDAQLDVSCPGPAEPTP